MIWKNNFVNSLLSLEPQIHNKITSLYGTGHLTWSDFVISKPDIIENMESMWDDGKPTKVIRKDGDNTVLSTSAIGLLPYTAYPINNLDHGQIVSSKQGQLSILNQLNLSNMAIEIEQNDLDQSIVAIIASPAKIKITGPDGSIYGPDNEMVVIPNPTNGSWTVTAELEGQVQGVYTVYFGRLSPFDEAWEEFTDVTNRSITYSVDWESTNLGADPVANAIYKMNLVNTNYPNHLMEVNIKYIKNSLDGAINAKSRQSTFSHTANIVRRVNWLCERLPNHPDWISYQEDERKKVIVLLRKIKYDALQYFYDRYPEVAL